MHSSQWRLGDLTYTGRDLRTAHERPRSMGLDDASVDVFLSHFRAVLEEFGVDAGRITAVMEIAEGGRSEVLARSPH